MGAHPAPPLLRCEPEQRATDGVSPSSRVLAFLQLSAHQDSQTKPDAKLCEFLLPTLLCEKLTRTILIPATFYKIACKPSRFACLMTEVLNSQDKYVTTPQEQLCPALPPLAWGAGSVLVCTTRLLPRGSFPRGHLAIFRKYLVAMAHERGVTGIRVAEAKTITPQWPLGTASSRSVVLRR